MSKSKRVPKRAECEVSTWFERDRSSVVVAGPDGATVAEWRDEDVGQMVEDGFFDASGFIMGREVRPGRLAESVLSYCASIGLVR
jgi:hypothetical protein